MLVIRRIHVAYRLRLRPEERETAERVHGFHQEQCPVARTIGRCVAITTALVLEERA